MQTSRASPARTPPSGPPTPMRRAVHHGAVTTGDVAGPSPARDGDDRGPPGSRSIIRRHPLSRELPCSVCSSQPRHGPVTRPGANGHTQERKVGRVMRKVIPCSIILMAFGAAKITLPAPRCVRAASKLQNSSTRQNGQLQNIVNSDRGKLRNTQNTQKSFNDISYFFVYFVCFVGNLLRYEFTQPGQYRLH